MTQNDTHQTNGGFVPVHNESDPLIPFDVRDQNGRRGLYILAGAIVALLVLATILFLTYQPGTRDRGIPPRVKADNQPFKVQPSDPGGAQTPDQDKSVYDVMAGKTIDETVVTTPGAEQPLQLTDDAMPKSANIQVNAPKVVAPKVSAPAPVKAPAPSKITPPKAEVPTQPVATGNGDYVVQVASVRSAEAATDVWNTINNKYSSIMSGGLYSDVVQVDLGDKGIFYRLRVAGLADKPAADLLCDQFKASGQACFVRQR